MNDIQKPVNPREDEDLYEKIRIAELEQKKYLLEEEEKKQQNKKDEKNFLVNVVFVIFQKIADLFSREEKKEFSLTLAAKRLRNNFETLIKSDVSEDSAYLKELSLSWENFIAAYEKKFLKENKHLPEIDSLIKEVDEYKSDQEYSLGYYLGSYKKETWHPYPFMTLLKNLKKEHETKKSTPIFQKAILKEKKENKTHSASSYLQKWITILTNHC